MVWVWSWWLQPFRGVDQVDRRDFTHIRAGVINGGQGMFYQLGAGIVIKAYYRYILSLHSYLQ